MSADQKFNKALQFNIYYKISGPSSKVNPGKLANITHIYCTQYCMNGNEVTTVVETCLITNHNLDILMTMIPDL